MSYSIYIGELKMEPIEEDEEYTTGYSRVVNGKVCYYDPMVKEIHQPDAPTFPNDEMTKNSNGRHPGYSQWGEFCDEVGLRDLFFNRETGLMREHPGHTALHVEHALAIEQALNRWKARHPDAQPGFDEFHWGNDYVSNGLDPILARLVWLDWWVKWALKNCENPAIYNH